MRLLALVLLGVVAPGGQARRGEDRSRRGTDKGALLGLVRGLASSLQGALAASEAKVGELVVGQGRLGRGLEEVRVEVKGVQEVLEDLGKEQEVVARRLAAIEDRTEMDQMLLRFNTKVCNTSIELVKKNVEERLSSLEQRQQVTTVASPVTEQQESSAPTSSPMDIFKKFESALMDYEYLYSYDEPTTTTTTQHPNSEELLLQVEPETVSPIACGLQVSGPANSSADPVASLVSETNSLLLSLTDR